MRGGPKARALTVGWRNISIRNGGRTRVYLILLSLILSFFTFAPITAKAAFAEPSGSWTDTGNFDISWYESNTSADYFEIDTPAKLAGVAKLVNSGTASFFEKRNLGDSSKRQQIIRITAPIDLSAHLWEPIGNGIDSNLTFCGIFDGGGFPITGMKVVSSAQYAGFFGVVGASGIGPTLLSINLSGNVNNSNSGDTS